MKNTNRQISPLGRSTKKNTQVYHSQIPPLFELSGNTFIYYNESPFIAHLKRIKFKFVRFVQPLHFVINFGRFPKIVKHNGMSESVSQSTHQLSFNF